MASSAVGSGFSGPAGRVYGWYAKPLSPLSGLPSEEGAQELQRLEVALGAVDRLADREELAEQNRVVARSRRASALDRRADQAAVEARRHGAAALGGLRDRGDPGGSARSRASRRRRRGSDAPPRWRSGRTRVRSGRVTPSRSPRGRRGPAGRGRRQREHHLEAARLGVGEHGVVAGPARVLRRIRPVEAARLAPAARRDGGPVHLHLDHVRAEALHLVERGARGCRRSPRSATRPGRARIGAGSPPAAAGSSARQMNSAVVNVMNRMKRRGGRVRFPTRGRRGVAVGGPC